MKRGSKYRLADSAVIEPLINFWSAWPYLVSPVPYSFYLLRYQTKLLESYLENPELHAKASNDPDLAGGAFVGIPARRAGEVRRLLEETLTRQAANLEFAGAITGFHNKLVDEADGLSLAPYYDLMPDSLRGYVELVYDYYNRPTMRFFENLLYASSYYQKELQALRLFKLERDNSRSFLINTPRLMEDDQVHWNVAYDDPRVDEFFSLDRRPLELGRIIELLGLTDADSARLLPMLSDSPKSCAERWSGRSARIRCLGHACALIEWNGVSVLTDPYIPVMPSEGGLGRISYQDLPETIDYVLITHIHHDHFALESLLRLRHRIEHIVVPRASGILYGDVSLKLMCQKLGFKNVIELEPMEAIDLPDMEIIALPFLGEHGDLAHSKSAYVIRAGKEQIMFGADSDCLDKRLYTNIRQSLGVIETVFLGTESVGAPLSWIYGPLLPNPPQRDHDESRRQHGSNSRAALDILEAVGAKRIYNYAMGLEPWMEYILGLGLTEDAPQWKESTRLLNKTRARGFLDSKRPYGIFELHLGEGSRARTAGFPGVGEEAGAEKGHSLGESGRRSLEFWQQQLESDLSSLSLAEILPASPVKKEGVSQQPFELSPAQTRSLKELADANDCSLLVVLLAILQTLLYRYSGQEEIVVGTRVSGRGTPETERLVGPLSKTIVFRTDLSGEPEFLTLLNRTREVLARALEHGDLPFKLLAESHGKSSPAAPAFRPGALLIIDEPGDLPKISGVEIERLRTFRLPAESDLTLRVINSGDVIAGTIEFDSDILGDETISTFIKHFRMLAQAVSDHPECQIDDISFLAEASPSDDEVSTRYGKVNDAGAQFAF